MDDFLFPDDIVNLTPHDIELRDAYGRVIWVSKPSGFIARCEIEKDRPLAERDGVWIVAKTGYGSTYGLPPEREGTMYIVSSHVFRANPDRTDLLVPGNQEFKYGKPLFARVLVANL